MKKTAFIFIVSALLIIVSSCKKSSSPSIVGTWGLQSFKRATIDSNFFPALIFNSDTTYADVNQYVFQFNSNKSFSLSDMLVTPGVHQTGTYSLISGNSLVLMLTGQSIADTLGTYTVSGNTLQITIVGSTPGTGPTALGSSFRELDTYIRQ